METIAYYGLEHHYPIARGDWADVSHEMGDWTGMANATEGILQGLPSVTLDPPLVSWLVELGEGGEDIDQNWTVCLQR